MVERVQELHIELSAHPSVDRHLLHDRDVPQVQALTAEARYPRGEVPDVVRQPDARVGALLRRIVDSVSLDRGVVEVEAADVEHRLVGIARIVALQRTHVAVEVGVAIVEADGPSALELPDSLQAPPADQRVAESGGPAGPPPAVAERHLPDAAERDAVRDVELRQPVLVPAVARIELEHALGE